MKKLQKTLSLLLVLVLGLGAVALSESTPTGTNNLIIKQVANETVVPLFYTPLTLEGLNHVVYAYNDAQGKVQFRVYGDLNGVTGFYPVTVSATPKTALSQDEAVFSTSVEANLQAVTEDQTMAGTAQPSAQAPATVPPGYQKWGTQTGLYYYTNPFGEKEYRLYGSYDGVTYDYYPVLPQTGTAVPGALAVDTQDEQQYIVATGQYADKPSTMAQGWKHKVKATLPGGEMVGVYTALPDFTTVEPQPVPTPQIITVTPTPAPAATKNPATGNSGDGTTLSQGSKGEAVLLLTRRLNILGYLDGTTRTYTQNVANAVKKFQRAYGLGVDGIAGPSTLKKINALVPSTSYLCLNHSGPKVTELTRKLVKIGYLSQETSLFNATVEQAVRSFQRNNGLAVDGIVGPNTERKINAISSGTTPTDPYWALYGSKLLKYGNSGEAVYQLSQRLIELGHLIYTERTFNQTVYDAVRNFQLGQGLVADGVVGQRTLAALKNPVYVTPPTAQPIPTSRPTDFPQPTNTAIILPTPTPMPTITPEPFPTGKPTENPTDKPTENPTDKPIIPDPIPNPDPKAEDDRPQGVGPGVILGG